MNRLPLAFACGLLSVGALAQETRPGHPLVGLLAGEVDARDRHAAVLYLEDARDADVRIWMALLEGQTPHDELPRIVRGLGRVGDPSFVPLLGRFLDRFEGPWTPELQRAAALAVGLVRDSDLLVKLAPRVGEADLARALGLVGTLPKNPAARGAVVTALSKASAATPSAPPAETLADAVVAKLTYGATLDEPLFAPLARSVLLNESASPEHLAAALHYFTRSRTRPAADLRERLAALLGSPNVDVAGLSARALARAEGGGAQEARAIARMLDKLEGPATELPTQPAHRTAQIDALRALAGLPLVEGNAVGAVVKPYGDAHLHRTALETLAHHGAALPEPPRAGIAKDVLWLSRTHAASDIRRVATLACAPLDQRAFLRELPAWHLAWDPLESTCRHASLSIL